MLLSAFAQETAIFQAQTRLVMVPFHAGRGNAGVTNLKQSDIVLLEDGKPREFTIFDVPSGADRMPVELVLLFDVNPPAGRLWDAAGAFPFVSQWSEPMSRTVLQAGGADVRVSVYRCFGQRLYRSTSATADAGAVTRALRGLLGPLPPQPEPGTVTELRLPPRRNRVDPAGSYTNDYVTSKFLQAQHRGWTLEAAIGLLNEMSVPGDRVSRVLVMFAEGISATTTVPEDVGNQALDLGIPIYPVATNYKGNITRRVPRNLFRMHQFEALGQMTGGRAVEYKLIDAAMLQKILTDVRGHALEQYVVGFAPGSNGEPVQHNLEVRLAVAEKKQPGKTTIEGGKRRAVY
jgi:hypothetical protein